MGIDRCFCFNVPFDRLKVLAATCGSNVDRLAEVTGCGTGCGFCRPYIRRMLETGVTDVPVLSSAEFNRLLSEESRPTPPTP
jgi:bacterioferritin-associated ferredoxin